MPIYDNGYYFFQQQQIVGNRFKAAVGGLLRLGISTGVFHHVWHSWSRIIFKIQIFHFIFPPLQTCGFPTMIRRPRFLKLDQAARWADEFDHFCLGNRDPVVNCVLNPSLQRYAMTQSGSLCLLATQRQPAIQPRNLGKKKQLWMVIYVKGKYFIP